jgi:SAM-dependent methyltransferase
MSSDTYPSSHPSFWDDRYAANDALFGTGPNAFVVSAAHRIPVRGEVVELGAGEARTLLWLARTRNVRGTAVDFSAEALQAGRRRAEEAGHSLDTVVADVRDWVPSRQWDAAVVTFLHLMPNERADLYQAIRAALRPGGCLVAEWFRPDHLSGDYDRMGPTTPARMVSEREVREAFSADDILHCGAADATLSEGPMLQGRAAVVRCVVQRSA